MSKLDEVRQEFRDHGRTIRDWAVENDFSPALVYQVLAGRNKGMRGESYEIAIALELIDQPSGDSTEFPYKRKKPM